MEVFNARWSFCLGAMAGALIGIAWQLARIADALQKIAAK